MPRKYAIMYSMNSMQNDNAKTLQKYLEGAKALEWDKYTLEQLGSSLRAKKAAYEKRKSASEKTLAQLRSENDRLSSMSGSYKKHEYIRSSFKSGFCFDGGAYLVVFFIWAAYTGFLGLMGVNHDLKILMIPLYIAQALMRACGNVLGLVIHLFALPLVFYLLISLAIELRSKAKFDREQDERAASFDAAERQKESESKAEWNSRIVENTGRIAELEKEISDIEGVILPGLDAEIQKNAGALAKAQSSLEKYYSPDILHLKYRGLVPVTTISEYFDTGRCEALTGHEGAYNLYESEYRLNMINAQLNTIQQQLAHISAQNASIQNAVDRKSVV